MRQNSVLSSYMRVAAAAPIVRVADIDFNTNQIINSIKSAAESGTELIVFPELSITGYSCADLFQQTTILSASNKAINNILEFSSNDNIKNMLIIIGAPIEVNSILYNCAVAINNGKIVAIIPKSYLPNYNEFYERRWFAPAANINNQTIRYNNKDVVFGNRYIIIHNNVKIAVELCEDLWTTIPPSSYSALAGAEIICNLSATNELYGKHKFLVSMLKQHSAKCKSAYIYSSSNYGESTTDMVQSGNTIILENGSILSKSDRFSVKSLLKIADVDIDIIKNDRIITSSYADCSQINKKDFVFIETTSKQIEKSELIREINPHPFIPASDSVLNECCSEILNIQTLGLMRRLEITNCKNLVIGISGGLDSTLALIVAVNAFDRLGLDRKGIIGITMPGFGTSGRTFSNAKLLMDLLQITSIEISIKDSVIQHLKDIGHSQDIHDTTYENAQARERTQILMDYSNKVGGMVLGTGDLSELALGWCTYNGDHMSMYAVNSGVPKTLVKAITNYYATYISSSNLQLSDVLLDIINTPISPELIPTDKLGNISQVTEDLVGPYELHDFFLYNMIKNNYTPKKIYYLAVVAFKDLYSKETVKHWLKTFYRRFFNQQFKRSCMPDGPKVLEISLSPRSDWRMPSDAYSSLWLNQCDEL